MFSSHTAQKEHSCQSQRILIPTQGMQTIHTQDGKAELSPKKAISGVTLKETKNYLQLVIRAKKQEWSCHGRPKEMWLKGENPSAECPTHGRIQVRIISTYIRLENEIIGCWMAYALLYLYWYFKYINFALLIIGLVSCTLSNSFNILMKSQVKDPQ